jgi:shikimate kinase / 3-dehydroquinate synthase
VTANVYLCGPPGAGKSTLAPLLAALRGLDAVDIDASIEAADGRAIAQIVDQNGEPDFRALERAAIAGVAQRGSTVVALGAGALEDDANLRLVTESGLLVFLDATVATCEVRTALADGTRPLLRRAGALAELHAARRAKYLNAPIRVRVDGLAPDDAARAVDTALREERVVRVATPKAYDVAIGPRVVRELPLRAAPLAGGRVVVVADERLAELGGRVVRSYEFSGVEAALLTVRADERLKSLDALGTLYASFAEQRLDRRGLVIGIGGGTIGDAVGFAAATFQRGVAFVAVPTTLLAAVDAAIGGKTAVNLPSGKNMVGTVTQPALVAIAPYLLRTLPPRDVVSGYGEMLKCGLALDAALYRALRAGEAALLDDPATAIDAIARCVELKAEIVAQDEEDRTGTRAILNFGHTVGHAIEKVAGYGTLRHGEAVIVGMRAALALSVAHGGLDDAARADADAHLAALPVPADWRGLDATALVDATRGDKKRHAGGTQFVLLDAIGSARVHDGIRPEDVRAALAEIGVA